MTTAREWDAAGYDRIAAPMTERGTGLVDRIPLAPDARVMDAGCGTGRVTDALRGRVPNGHVVALDGSRAMVDAARARLGDDRVTYVHADLARDLPPMAPLDAVVSTSTLHWVPDHPAVFRRLAAVLRPGGTLALSMSVDGSIAEVCAALDAMGEPRRWNFPTPDGTRDALDAAGFDVVEERSVPQDHVLPDDAALRDYLRTTILCANLDGRAPAEGERLVDRTARALPDRCLRYRRIEVVARRR